MDYWEECVSEAFDDAGITATDAQINTVAGWVESAHTNYGMAYGHDVAQSPVETGKDRTIAALQKQIRELESDISIFRKSVAQRRGCLVENVEIERYGQNRGDVIYRY